MNKRDLAQETRLTSLAILENGWREELRRVQNGTGEMPEDRMQAIAAAVEQLEKARVRYDRACARIPRD